MLTASLSNLFSKWATRHSLALARYALLLGWGAGHALALRWMWSGLAHPTHVVQRFVLLGLTLAAMWGFTRQASSPDSHPKALQIGLLGLVCSAAVGYFSSIQFAVATGALLALGAVSACFLDARTWRQRSVWLLAVLLCLPIQSHVDAHLGLPLRLWTAHTIAPLLHMMGVANVSVESIIVTENGVADIASACSGVRTLWYAVALWLLARVVWPHAPRLRWCLAGGLAMTIAVGLNSMRVMTLVLALHHHAPPLLVDMAHASLGLLALAMVGGVQWLLCHTPLAHPTTLRTSPAALDSKPATWHTAMVLACLSVCLIYVPQHARHVVEPGQLKTLMWPVELQTSAVPFLEVEKGLVLGHDATVAEKHRFNFRGLQGSLLVVASNNWRAHHAPELCLLAQGARLERLEQVSAPHGAYRVMTMQSGSQVAITWFQSHTRVVPDLGARIWSNLFNPSENWALVTVVIDSAPSNATLLELHGAIYSVVAAATQTQPGPHR